MAGSDASPEISPAAPPPPQTPPATAADSAAPESETVPETAEAPLPPQTPPAPEAPESKSPTAEEPAAPESVEVTEPETAPAVEEPAALESVEAAEVTESESAPAAEDPPPPVAVDAASAAPVASLEAEEIPIVADSPDNKRKLEDLVDGEAASESAVKAPESVSPLPSASADPATPTKRQRLDGESDCSALAGDEEMQKIEAPVVVNGQPPAVDHDPTSNNSFYQQGSVTYEQQQASSETTSRKFEIPNNKVGALIGKSGETIRVLQLNSGAKIQITKDNEADPNSSYRPVELIGTLECINKAEQLIKDVIAAAEAGGSPALVARGFGNGQSGSEQHEMQVPNDKVGLIIGKGGETIKNLQTRSGARIQLIPQHLPEGESANEKNQKILRLTGYKKQIEDAKEMIKEVMNQAPVKRTHSSGGYNQQSFRPRGPSSGSQWGTRMPAPAQQRGMYPPQSAQYPPQSYGSYTQHHMPPRNSTSTAWDQRAGAPIQTAEYNNYYGQGGQGANNQSIPAAASSQAPVNYNYGPSQSVGYGQQVSYVQSAQQSYNQGFNEQNYDGQARGQYYGQQPVNSQPGAYPQQGGVQMNYPQQQSYYGPPQPQSTDPMYQGSVQTSYGAGEPTLPSYYGQTGPTQPAPVYGQALGPTLGTTDGYAQPSSAAVYPQQSSQVAPGYAQGGQPAPTYTQQAVQSGGYVQYPPQQGYGDQSAPNNVNYGYQGGPAEAGYGGNSNPVSGYGPALGSNQTGYGQTGYPQQQTYPTGYEQQSVPPQSGYVSQPGKGVSPQPGYGAQYYST